MTSVNKLDLKPKATRQAFGEMLAELGANHPQIVVLDADLSKSTKSELFAKKFPDRFFEMGIAEANMIGTGAGFALSGYTAFICSFGAFVTGRYDQIRMSVSYANANVKIIGTHSGIGIGDDGHSQMGLEDISMMRGLPGMVVLQPGDEMETRQAVVFAAQHYGPVYLRLTRQNLIPIHDENYKFQIGKLDVFKGGKGVAIFSTGATVQEAVQAEKILAQNGIQVTLVNVHTFKPFDAEGVAQLAKNHSQFVSVEDHYVTGGLASALSEVIATRGLQVKLTPLGVQDQFGESGDPQELFEKFGFSAKKIAEKVKSLI